MSARKPRHVYLVYYTHDSGPETGEVEGLYFTYTAARRACDAYRTSSATRWTPWSITRDRAGRVTRAASTTDATHVYDDGTETWSSTGFTANLDIHHRVIDDTTVIAP